MTKQAGSSVAAVIAGGAAGIASGLIYLSLAMTILFLIPVQVVFSGWGRKEGFTAAATALIVIAAGQTIRLTGTGIQVSAYLLWAVLPPAALLGSLVLVEAVFAPRTGVFSALLLITAFLSLAMVPMILSIGSDESFTLYIKELVEILSRQISTPAGIDYDSAEARVMLDPATLVASAKHVLVSGYSLFILILVGGSWWLGTKLALRFRGGHGRASPVPLGEFKVPDYLLWPALGSWTALFLVLASKTLGWPQAIVWNLALVFAFSYALQGAGVITGSLNRRNAPRTVRVLAALSVLVALANPVVGKFAAGALAILGISEVWIPYRNLKGDRT